MNQVLPPFSKPLAQDITQILRASLHMFHGYNTSTGWLSHETWRHTAPPWPGLQMGELFPQTRNAEISPQSDRLRLFGMPLTATETSQIDMGPAPNHLLSSNHNAPGLTALANALLQKPAQDIIAKSLKA